MTVVFKSDIRADSSANVSNFAGYLGPVDHYIYADISNQIYKKNGATVNLTDILASTGQKKFYGIADKLGNVEDSIAGFPRRSFVPAHGVFAIMAETANAGFVFNSDIVISGSASATYAAYATKGKLTFDSEVVNLLSGSGTVLDPYIFKYKNTTTIPFALDRNDANAVCTQCVGNRVPLNIVKGRDNVSDSDINIKITDINKAQFAIVLRVISPKLGSKIGNADGYVPIVKFFEDSGKSISYVKVRNASLNIQTRNANMVKGNATEAAPVTQVVDTYAISFDNGKVNHYMNGARINAPEIIQLPSFVLNEIKILSTDVNWLVSKNSDALVNLIMYNRALSDVELANCLFK